MASNQSIMFETEVARKDTFRWSLLGGAKFFVIFALEIAAPLFTLYRRVCQPFFRPTIAVSNSNSELLRCTRLKSFTRIGSRCDVRTQACSAFLLIVIVNCAGPLTKIH